MADGLDRLGHDAVVGGDHEHRDVGDVRAARSHRRERFVARRVDEGDEPIRVIGVSHHAIRTDALGDATGFARDDVRVADAVEQRGLSVVDVTHHRDDGRARLEERLVFVVIVGEHGEELDLLLAPGLDEQDLRAECLGDQLDHLVGERNGGGHHLAGLEQDANEIGGRPVELRRELLHGDAARDDDLAFGNRRVGRREPLRRGLELGPVATTLLAPALRRATGTAAPGRAAVATAGSAAGTAAAATTTGRAACGTSTSGRTTGTGTGTTEVAATRPTGEATTARRTTGTARRTRRATTRRTADGPATGRRLLLTGRRWDRTTRDRHRLRRRRGTVDVGRRFG